MDEVRREGTESAKLCRQVLHGMGQPKVVDVQYLTALPPLSRRGNPTHFVRGYVCHVPTGTFAAVFSLEITRERGETTRKADSEAGAGGFPTLPPSSERRFAVVTLGVVQEFVLQLGITSIDVEELADAPPATDVHERAEGEKQDVAKP